MNNIKNTFESFSPSEEQKQKIYASVIYKQANKDKKERQQLKPILVCGLIAYLIMIIATTFILTSINNVNKQASVQKKNSQTVQTANNIVLPTNNIKSVVKGFILTAYTADEKTEYLQADFTEKDKKVLLTPDVKVMLSKYSPAISCVPGLPFTVDISWEDKNNLNIEGIRACADSGELLVQNKDTGIISSIERSNNIDVGETIFWSPITGNGSNAYIKNITITIEAVDRDHVIGRQKINITQDEAGYYYAIAGELELM